MRSFLVSAITMLAATAHAQGVDRRYAEEPTDGMAMPLAPLAGEHDARAVSTNPGGLALLRGAELALALDLEDTDVATTAGQGFGAFLASTFGGGLLPKFALGMGLEWLRPPREQLAPDPGEPFRFTLAYGLPIGKHAGLGVAWRHFIDDGLLDGVDTFDLGLSTRWGNRLAIGATVRDLATTEIGGIPVQRRYELEAVVRPFSTSALEVAIGGRIGETRLDLDGWARVSGRIARGVAAHLGVETRELHALAFDSLVGTAEREGRDVRAMAGLEVSFGGLAVTGTASGLRDDRGDRHALGGQLLVRASAVPGPSVLGTPDHIERVELSGAIGLRELTSLVARLRAISRDPTAKALIVTFDSAEGGWATLEELRTEILAVKAAGKKVFAYMVSGTGRDYFIASAAHKIYVDPAGGVRLVGMAGTTMFFRGAFQQIGVDAQFEKIAEYKSAPEQFTQTGPSEAATKMNNAIYDGLWDRWVAAVADGRKLSKDEVKQLVDNGPYTAGDLAKDQKLVDAVAAPDKIAELVMKEIGRVIGVARPPVERPSKWRHPQVAVIYIEGDITDGASRSIPLVGSKLAGSQTLVGAIAAARANPDIGAIILRIDTPGGSALASELISREVFATRGVKPILCSFSDVAASGGYFIAAGCDTIFAEPMTITGSIGIFFGKFDVSGLASKLGISTTIYKRGARSDTESYFRPYTEQERAVLLDKLRYMYGRFVGAVAEGRGMKKDEVDAVGRGHVYTGEQAKAARLVDRHGGFGDALDEAKRRMKLSPGARVQLVELPQVPSSLLGALGSLLGAREEASVSVTDLPMVKELVRGIPPSILVGPEGAQARLPYELTWD
ncbi:MAG TPA: signal peptide peptidase SppA [Kofleriaceae bacterium]|nr:signal peptide peptidase SppA [Kofleriaceae bacterium]